VKNIQTRKLVISHNKGNVYHHFRKTYNLNKKDLFYIMEDETINGIETGSHYFIYEGKVINSFDVVCDLIDAFILEKKRQLKIEQILK